MTFTTKTATLLLISLAISGHAAPMGRHAKQSDDKAPSFPLADAAGKLGGITTAGASKREYERENEVYDYSTDTDTSDVTYNSTDNEDIERESTLSRMMSTTTVTKRYNSVYAANDYSADSQSSNVDYSASQQSANEQGSSVYSATNGGNGGFPGGGNNSVYASNNSGSSSQSSNVDYNASEQSASEQDSSVYSSTNGGGFPNAGYYGGGYSSVYAADNNAASSQSSDVDYDASQQSANEQGSSVYSSNNGGYPVAGYYGGGSNSVYAADNHDASSQSSDVNYNASQQSANEQDSSVYASNSAHKRHATGKKEGPSGFSFKVTQPSKRDSESSLNSMDMLSQMTDSTVDYTDAEEHDNEREHDEYRYSHSGY